LKKDKPVPLVDLYEQEAQNARTATEGPRLDGDESSADEGGNESSQEDGEAGEESAEGAPTAGDFEVQAGWHVMSSPLLARRLRQYDWKKKRLAHVWDPPFAGWDIWN